MVEITKNKKLYLKGIVIDNQLNGQGFQMFSDGVSYEGEFKEGQFHGDGKLVKQVDKNKENIDLKKNEISMIYGKFYKGAPKGKCNIQWVNGDQYEGAVKDWQPNGKGQLIKENGEKYRGAFK